MSFFGLLSGWFDTVISLIAILFLLVWQKASLLPHIAGAFFVYQCAVRRQQATMNINPYWWAFFTLTGGLSTLLIYWLIEHSTLSPRGKSGSWLRKALGKR